jgi:fructose-specific PTS system IIA-like component
MLSEVARRYSAAVRIGRGDTDGVDARSVLSIVGLDVKHGEVCVVVAEGADAAGLIAAVKELVETRLAEGDEVVVVEAGDGEVEVAVVLPRGLRGVSHAAGRGLGGGVGEGEAVMVEGLRLPKEVAEARAESSEKEMETARRAIEGVRQELERKAEAGHGMVCELLRAHAEIVDDPALWSEVERRVNAGATAPQAVVAAAERFVEKLRGAASQYIRDRVVDVQDVSMQVLNRLVPGGLAGMCVKLTGESVVFAEALTANQLLGLDRKLLKGLVLGKVGATSHTVILARSHRIPTVIDVVGAGSLVKCGERVVVDGDGGFVVTAVGDSVTRYYEKEKRARARWLARVGPAAKKKATTADGVGIEVGANASTADEVVGAVGNGADGVGLLRTELLFLDRATAPTEEEQFTAYSAVVKAAGHGAVIIRTFDIGGDKPAAYLSMPREENPFLGVRGLRLYPKHSGMMRTQLRAIVRASAVGKVKVMAPMVATPEEAGWFRHQVREVQSELTREGVPIDQHMPIGVMVEVPAAAMAMDRISDEVDFFSIGTNDLCQYWMAVDRGNAGVAKLYNARQPSFLRLLKTIADGAKAHRKWIGVCGEMAGVRENLPLMIGLGVDEISVAPGEVLGLKSAVAGADAGQCRELLDAAMKCRTAEEVEEMLKGAVWRSGGGAGSILDREMIEVGSDAASKEEAIKHAVDLLMIAGRTERPRMVEEAVWAREAMYSTGLGYGFAVPHCKTDAVSGPALAVLKLRQPVEWGSMDGRPVEVLMLLAVPLSETAGGGGTGHMKVFAKLARKLMHEEFRAKMMDAVDSRGIEACLREELGIE